MTDRADWVYVRPAIRRRELNHVTTGAVLVQWNSWCDSAVTAMTRGAILAIHQISMFARTGVREL